MKAWVAALALVFGMLGCVSAPSGGGAYYPLPSGNQNGVVVEISDLKVAVFKGDLFSTFLSPIFGTPGSDFHAAAVQVKNVGPTPVQAIVKVGFPGYANDMGAASVTLQAGETQVVQLDVPFDFVALSGISAPIQASWKAEVQVDGKVVAVKDKTVQVLPKGTVFWVKPGVEPTDPNIVQHLAFGRLLVTGLMTTPHDGWGEVDKLLKEAADYSKFGAMLGYQYDTSTEELAIYGAMDQVGAIFGALQYRGVNYTNVPAAFYDSAQNVRYPAESLKLGSQNCIDGSLVFASALESMGMNAAIVFVPGHAFVAVQVMPDKNFWLFIETTVIASKSFDEALQIGVEKYQSAVDNGYFESGQAMFIEVAAARKAGIKPSPFPM